MYQYILQFLCRSQRSQIAEQLRFTLTSIHIIYIGPIYICYDKAIQLATHFYSSTNIIYPQWLTVTCIQKAELFSASHINTLHNISDINKYPVMMCKKIQIQLLTVQTEPCIHLHFLCGLLSLESCLTSKACKSVYVFFLNQTKKVINELQSILLTLT